MECVAHTHTHTVTLQMSLQACREANDFARHLIYTGRDGDRSEPEVGRMNLRLGRGLHLGL